MITIEPLGGLANRMRVITSGIWLKEKTGAELRVIWNENNELNCPYKLLFDDSDFFKIKGKNLLYKYLKRSNRTDAAEKRKANVNNYLLGVDYCIIEEDFPNLIFNDNLDLLQIAKKHRHVYIQTCQEFGDNQQYFKHMRPIFPVRQKIKEISQHFDEFTIGVHIRRTDHKQSIENSPISLFISAMDKDLSINDKTTFFLCTDDEAVEQELVGRYGDRIIVYKKDRSRQSVKGIQDALIDLHCLSKTARILGSYWSSFSEIGAKMNNTPLQTLRLP